ncbi:MAG: cytidine deaminase [Bacillota bacterium]
MSHDLSENQIQELIARARETMGQAYAPYSRFRVGAALLTKNGRIFTGCNVENASYGLTNCAERTAVFKAVSEGDKGISALALIADTDDYCVPCGACRQVMAEFGDFPVIQANRAGAYKINNVSELLPGAFSGAVLPGRVVE